MITTADLQQLILTNLPCEHIDITGDGHHWFATLVSADFDGLNSLARHRKVYSFLEDKLETNELHALSLRTYTPAEWQKITVK